MFFSLKYWINKNSIQLGGRTNLIRIRLLILIKKENEADFFKFLLKLLHMDH